MTPEIRKIVVPTDLGPFAGRAVAYAGVLARGFHASVHLVHVLENPSAITPAHVLGGSPPDEERLYHSARAKLAALAAAELQPTDRVTLEVRTGIPWKAIVDAAIDYGADLIVMSSPPYSAVATLVQGTVAERVSRSAPCPVFLVRHPRERSSRPAEFVA